MSIYALADGSGIRYIGQTTMPAKRLSNLIARPRWEWLRELLAEGRRPEMIVLEEVAPEHADERERHWIKHHHALGCDLSNTALGGLRGGTFNKPRAAVERTAEAHRGRPKSPEHRARLSAALAGHKRSAESIEKQRQTMLGHRHSEETRERMRAAARARWAAR